MVNLVSGVVALIALVGFLSLYLARIPSVAFWLVTLVVVGFAITDFVVTVRAERAFRDAAEERAGDA